LYDNCIIKVVLVLSDPAMRVKGTLNCFFIDPSLISSLRIKPVQKCWEQFFLLNFRRIW